MKISIILIFLLAVTFGCETKNRNNNKKNMDQRKFKILKRWYSQPQVDLGKELFAKNCAECHGEQGKGITTHWNQPLADGSYPPPPLNGTAHAWHHPMMHLKQTINDGGIAKGGKMPPFNDKLKEKEQFAVIAYFQSFWNNKIYSQWLEKSGMK